MEAAHARETLKILKTCIKYGILTDDDLNRIDVIALNRLEELDEENND